MRDPPRGAVGGLRPATATDRDLLIEWEQAFAVEAGVRVRATPRARSTRVAVDGQLVWDDEVPPANKIHASVGFRPFAEWEEHGFGPGVMRRSPGGDAQPPAGSCGVWNVPPSMSSMR